MKEEKGSITEIFEVLFKITKLCQFHHSNITRRVIHGKEVKIKTRPSAAKSHKQGPTVTNDSKEAS